MSDPRVSGVGHTHFTQDEEWTARDMFAKAGLEALDDAGVTPDDVEALYYGNFMGEMAEHQGHQGPMMAEAVGASDVASTRYESACASAGAAVRQAVRDVRNGEADLVLVGGAERMTNIGTAGATEALSIAADDLYEVNMGITFPGAYALMARAYFERYGGSSEDLAHVAVKNHDNALENEYAQLQRAIDVEDHQEAPQLASPLGLYDACPITDGAAAVVIASADYADDQGLDDSVVISGTGQASDRLALQDREDITHTPAAAHAAEEAYDDAGITADDVDFAEVHDCFTIAEVLASEALGFFEKGEGISKAREGVTTRDGEQPINVTGGLKAKGHPVGATGASQVGQITMMLRGDHGRSDAVSDATVGVAHNAGGTAASTTIHVLEVNE